MIVLSEKFLSLFGRVTHCVALSMLLASCGIKSEISTTTVGASLAGVTVSKIRPIEAKPSDLLTIEGSNFSASKDLRARVSLEDGSTKDVPLKVIDRTKGTFVMPDGAGLGLKSVSIFQGGSKQVASLGIVANTAENKLPILIDEPSEICSTKQYIDRNGDQQTGTKDCAAGTTLPQCSTDGGSNCVVDGTIYLAAAKATATAANIKSGVIIAGVLGTATLESHSNCNSNGQQSCVAAGTYFAGTACAADGSNCFLRSYSVPGLQTKKAVDVSTIDSTKMLDTLTVSGITGNVASRGSWNLTTAFPGEGFFTGVSNSLAASSYTGTLLGTDGTATLESHSNCASDGATGCVAVGTYPAALATGAASKIISGQTLAGVPGNVTLPAVGKVYTGITYGVGGTGSTGTLTIPAAGNVLSTAPAYGDPGAQLIPSLTSQGTWNLTTSFPGAGYYAAVSNSPTAATIATGTTITGVAGSVTLPAASDVKSGTTSYGAAGTQFTPSYSPDFPDVANVKTTDTVNGATGTLDLTNLLASNIKSGVTIAGVSGNVTLPANCSEDGITGCVTTSSFKSADMTSAIAGNIKTGATIAGVPGSVTSESHSSCASDGAIGCVTVAGFKSADMSVAIAGNIKSGITIAGQLGDYPSVTYKLPRAEGATADLADLDNATFDIKVKSATAFEYWTSTGSYQTGAGDADITQANIKDTVSIFGTVGNLTAAVAPNSWDVRVGVTVNGVTGKLKVNCRNRVGSTFNYDGAISGIGQSAPVTPGTTFDIWDTIDDYNANSTGLPPSIVTAWGSNTDCGGIDTPNLPSDDDNVWKDVTTTNGTTASTCAATSANCTMQDKITGLWWSKLQTAAAWDTAWSTCLTTLNGTNSVPGYNGQTGWRLPTQKELIDAYNHGIRSAADKPPINNWITEVDMANNYFWSGSSRSDSTNSAWVVYLANGSTNYYSKFATYQVVCVK